MKEMLSSLRLKQWVFQSAMLQLNWLGVGFEAVPHGEFFYIPMNLHPSNEEWFLLTG
tara:strand:- start:726 stop:896 length:171 start_codon:yes stop_codon:yes gene_type:complete